MRKHADRALPDQERRGRLSVPKLIAHHGADMRLPDLREIDAGAVDERFPKPG